MSRWELRPAEDHGLTTSERLASLKRETGLLGAAGRLLWWLAMRSYLRLYHRLEIRGRENLPAAPPFLMIGNHASHLDAPTLAACLPLSYCDRAFALAAGDTFFGSTTSAALITASLNALPVWRQRTRREHLAAMRARLTQRPCVFLLFPEGTRSRSGEMGSFKPGMGWLVADTAVPVVPCYIDGAHAAFPPGAKLPRSRPLRVTIGKPLDFSKQANDADGWRVVAEQSETAVRALAVESGAMR